MKRLARSRDGTALIGDDSGFVPLAAADPGRTSVTDALAAAAAGDLPDPADAPARRRPTDQIRFAKPLERPGKLWGIGLNYVDHAADLDEDAPEEPASFMKPSTAAVGPGGPIRLPSTDQTDRVTAEGELGVVIGRTCSDVDADEAGDVIAGYVPLIDMTAEDILRRNPRFLTRAKSFDSFLVFGPTIAVPEPADRSPEALAGIQVRTEIGDETIAENVVANMAFPPHELVAFHSRVMTLEPGDVISTGTPGAGVIDPGDSVTAVVEGIGSVSADVVR